MGCMPGLVVCVGLTTIDLVQTVESIPGPNQKVVAQASTLDVGGPAANAARVARGLGCRVRLVTALGGSVLARLARDQLTDIELIDVASPSHQLPLSAIMLTPNGDRSVVSRNAASLAAASLPSTEVLDGADVVLHDGHLIDASVALAAQPAPIHLLDGGSWKPGLPRLLPLLDIAVVSGDFALPGHSAEQALADLAGYGIPRLARTRGGQPVQVLIGEQQREFPVPQVAVVDTLGAGDVLHGALAAHLAGEADFTSSLQRAIELASRSVTGRGVLAALA